MSRKVAPVLICVLLFGGIAIADDEKKPDQPQPDPAEMQKLFEKYAKPGKQHKNLRRLVGKWSGEVTSYQGPKPTKSTGTATFRAILGGRYVVQNWKGKVEGKPFVGMGIAGYDNAKKQYVSVWMDNMGTGFMNSTGSYDAKTQTLTEVGEFASPVGKMKMRMVSKYTDNDHFSMTMYMSSPEGEKKAMEIKYTRMASTKKPKKPKKTDKATKDAPKDQ